MTPEQPSINEFFRDLRPRSRESVAEALRALRRPGVSGTLVIQIPPEESKPCEIVLVLGPAMVTVDLTKF